MTVTIRLSGEDLAETRFAFSPIWELGMSIFKPLRDPARHALHLPWVQEARRATTGRDLSLLFSLAPPPGLPPGLHAYIPDFLTPPPQTPFPQFEEELDRVARTPPERIAQQIRWMRASTLDAPLAPPAERMLADPAASLPRLIDEMREYWKLAIEPHWPRIRSLLEADVTYRARQLALGGADLLFADLHPSLRWHDGVITLEKDLEDSVDTAGRGLVLIPAVFDWPGVAWLVDADQPALSYAPRGIATLWETDPPARTGTMDELIGGTRADILRVLETPMTTGELARRLRITPAAVSQQLGMLRRAGVIAARRQGREVFSELTPQGVKLLELLG